MGIDPGSRVMGYGVVEQLGTSLRAIDHGTLSPGGEAPLADRLLLLFEGLTTLVAAHKPQAVAVEAPGRASPRGRTGAR